MRIRYASDKDRILRNFQKAESGCWEWTKGKDMKGYGKVWFRDKTTPAHRVSYTVFVGEIPSGMCVLHTCDNPGCVNPKHLWIGTLGDNNTDRMKKGRNYDMSGENGPGSKLSEKDAIEIMRLALGKIIRYKEIAKMFNISTFTVSDILGGKSWKHLERGSR